MLQPQLCDIPEEAELGRQDRDRWLSGFGRGRDEQAGWEGL